MPLGLPELDSLVRIGQLKAEPRNLAEYEAYLDVEEPTVAEMCALVQGLLADVQAFIAN